MFLIIRISRYLNLSLYKIHHCFLVIEITLSFFQIIIQIRSSFFFRHQLSYSKIRSSMSHISYSLSTSLNRLLQIALSNFQFYQQWIHLFLCDFPHEVLFACLLLALDFQSNQLFLSSFQLSHKF